MGTVIRAHPLTSEVPVSEPDLDAEDPPDAVKVTQWWSLAYKAGDVVFKLASWLLVVVAMRTAAEVSGSGGLRALAIVLGNFYALILMVLGVFLFGGIYNRSAIPAGYTAFLVLGRLAGLALLVFLVSPLFWLDELVAALAAGLRR